ncbi:HNH endonuclease signature motif containing protein [Streptomyces sp. SID13031]|uniref:HNH endonuclease signature motif containing protein n=1 Tax=Streptomyces sp. SID13031 TaxID=2706046 RepID=UPI0013CAA7B1|nr:HNH endonuclease signature motif containing protein [Streptomyces sp. SID13031]NEA30929.1 HNH endonuclease [Streptomyces sp. SID13031]
MFDDGWGDFDAAATLDAAVEFDVEENRAALGKLQATLHFADLHASLPPAFRRASQKRGGERLVVYGGDGCPAIAEFAPAEFGVLLKLSSGAAAAYIGEALALRHRLPRIWAKTVNGQAIVWRARAVARACLKLSREAAALVDERVVAVIDTLSAYSLQKIVEAVIKEADPEAARQAAEERARERGVWVQQSDDHGTKTIWVKAAAGEVIRFDATINDLAWALQMLGDPDTLQARRAKAIGWIADPLAAYELVAAARYLAAQPDNSAPTKDGQDSPREPTAAAPDLAAPRHLLDDAEADSHARHHREPDPHTPDHREPGRREPDHREPDSPESGTHGSGSDEPELREPDLDDSGLDDEADRDVVDPHLGDQPTHPAACPAAATKAAIDPFSRHQLAGKLAAIKKAAAVAATGISRADRVVLYVHLTDQALLSGEGVVRVENHGSMLAAQLKELLGHDRVILKPVIDLNQHVDVNAYEIPTRIRERVGLTQPVERFPYSTAETTARSDLDHIKPYDPHGPPGQTSTSNLTPATRFHHRVKTHGRWKVQRSGEGALQWTTPNGFTFRVDHLGTHRLTE